VPENATSAAHTEAVPNVESRKTYITTVDVLPLEVVTDGFALHVPLNVHQKTWARM
jgi:hypothetical protein